MNASLTWVEGMKFRSDNHGLISTIDAALEHGGTDQGPTPKELVLNAMMGCTAMDVVAMLKKMRQEISEFKMDIEAEKTSIHPIHFKNAILIFKIGGDVDPEKAIKSVDASLSKYCGVNYMISKTCAISYKLFINGNLVKEAPVKFIEPASEITK